MSIRTERHVTTATVRALRAALRAGATTRELRYDAAGAILRTGDRLAIAAGIASWPAQWPLCWCDCGELATHIEGDSGDGAAEDCQDYACDADGEPVCACDPRVEDDGEWTGGGPLGIGSQGWVSRLVVRDE